MELSITRSLSGAAKIVLKGKYSEGGPESEEGFLKIAAYPGTNVTLAADYDQEMRHGFTPGSTDYAGTGTNVTTTKNPMWLLKEDPLQGKTIADQYAAGDNVFVHLCSPGETVQVLVASGQTVAKGQGLSAGSSGLFVNDAANAACIALESTSGALASDTLIRVMVL